MLRPTTVAPAVFFRGRTNQDGAPNECSSVRMIAERRKAPETNTNRTHETASQGISPATSNGHKRVTGGDQVETRSLSTLQAPWCSNPGCTLDGPILSGPYTNVPLLTR
jgi:hypothetical protein